jgi:hypothetical protein
MDTTYALAGTPFAEPDFTDPDTVFDLQPAVEDRTEHDEACARTRITNPLRVERRKRRVEVTPERLPDRSLSREDVNGMTLAEILDTFGLPKRYLRGDEDHEGTTARLDASVLSGRA